MMDHDDELQINDKWNDSWDCLCSDCVIRKKIELLQQLPVTDETWDRITYFVALHFILPFHKPIPIKFYDFLVTLCGEDPTFELDGESSALLLAGINQPQDPFPVAEVNSDFPSGVRPFVESIVGRIFKFRINGQTLPLPCSMYVRRIRVDKGGSEIYVSESKFKIGKSVRVKSKARILILVSTFVFILIRLIPNHTKRNSSNQEIEVQEKMYFFEPIFKGYVLVHYRFMTKMKEVASLQMTNTSEDDGKSKKKKQDDPDHEKGSGGGSRGKRKLSDISNSTTSQSPTEQSSVSGNILKFTFISILLALLITFAGYFLLRKGFNRIASYYSGPVSLVTGLICILVSIWYFHFRSSPDPMEIIPEVPNELLECDLREVLDSKPNREKIAKIISLFYNLEVDPELHAIGVPVIPNDSALGCFYRLIILVWVKERAPELMSFICSSEAYSEKRTELVEKFKIAMTDEGFFSVEFPNRRELLESFDAIEQDPDSAVFEKAQFSETAYARLLQLIRPVDFARLLFLLKRTKDVVQMVNGNLGSGIVLLGPREAGTGIIIHACAGSGFKKNGKSVLVPAEPNKLVKDVQVDNLGRSVTERIVAVPFVPATMSGENPHRSDLTVHVLECPALFGSTGEIEPKLAKSFGIVNTLNRIKSIYPVLVMSSEITARCWGVLIDFMKAVVKLVPDIKSNLSSFVYIFTHGFEHETNPKLYINSSINEKIHSLSSEEFANRELMALLKDVAMKTNPVTGWKQAFLISDPRTPDVKFGDLLHTIVSGTPISRENAFTAFCDQEGIIGAQMSVELVQRILVSCSNLDGRVNFETINYYLQMIKLVGDYLEFDVFQSSYSQMIQKVLAAIRVHGVGKLESFFNALNGIEIVSKSKEEEARFINQCEELKNAQEGIFNAYEMIGNHISRYDKLTPAFFEDGMKNFIHENLILTLRNRLNNNASESLTNYILQARMERLAVAVGYFPCLHDSFEEAKTLVQDYCSNLLNKFSNIVMNPSLWDISVMVPALNDLLEASNHFSEYLDPPRKYENCKTILLKEMQKWNKQAEKVLSKLIEEDSERENVQALASRYNSAVCDPDFSRHFHPQLQSMQKEFTSFVANYSEKIAEFINQALEERNAMVLHQVQRHYSELSYFTKISCDPDALSRVTKLKLSCKMKMDSFLSVANKECSTLLESLELNELTSSESKQLAHRIAILSECTWKDPGDYPSIDSFKVRIEAAYKLLLSRIQSIPLSLNNFEELPNLIAIKIQLEIAAPLVSVVPEVESIINQYQQIYHQKRSTMWKEIQEFIPLGFDKFRLDRSNLKDKCKELLKIRLDPGKLLRIHQYFATVEKHKLPEEPRDKEVAMTFHRFQSAYVKALKDSLDFCFENLMNPSINFVEGIPEEDEDDCSDMVSEADRSIYTGTATTTNQTTLYSDKSIHSINNWDFQQDEHSSVFLLALSKVKELGGTHADFRTINDKWMNSNPLEYLPGKLYSLFHQMDNDLEVFVEEMNFQEIFSNSMKCKHLPKLDQLFQDVNPTERICFRELYRKYSLASNTLLDTILERISTNWNRKQFSLVRKDVIMLKNSGSTRAEGKLRKLRSSLMIDIRDWKEFIDTEHNRNTILKLDVFQTFADTLLHLRKARDEIGYEFLDKSWCLANLSDEYFQKIIKSIINNITDSRTIEKFMEVHDFTQLETRKTLLTEVDYQFNEFALTHELVSSSLISLESLMESKLEELVRIFANSEINEYKVNPAYIYQAMEPLLSSSQVSPVYHMRWKKLKNAIEQNTIHNLQEIEMMNVSFQERKYHLQKIESLIRQWPMDLQESLRYRILDLKHRFEIQENSYEFVSNQDT